ncbi:MAG: PAS domain-containing sensor histidine kinase [Acidobacteria bacterium]|nr:MAG: PAS domain-containing sensor histidine kinase [Acidobacteriota bacterium]
MRELHSLLRRQLKKCGLTSLDELPPAWRALLAAVDDAYRQSDVDRRMLERSLDLSSEELLAANDDMRALFDASPDLFVRLAADGTILDYRGGSSAVSFLPGGAAVGTRIQEVAPESVGARFREAIARVRRDDATVEIEYGFADGGRQRRFEARLLPLRNRQIMVIVRDITEAHRAAEALRRSEQRRRLHFQQTPLAAIEWNVDFQVVEWNPAAERIFGYRREETLGRHAWELIMPPATCTPGTDFARNPMVQTGDNPITVENRTKSGQRIVCEWYNTLLVDGAGAVVGMASLAHDVSERTRLKERLEQAQRMEAIGRLAGGIAHDFNNLLTTIIGACDLGLARLERGMPLADELHDVRRAGERAADLVKQLLAFSRQQVLEPKIMDLNQVVAEVEKMLSRLIGEDVELVTRRAASLGRIRADPGQIEQVLVNLMVNARDAMPDGGRLSIETANVELTAADELPDYVQPGSYVRLRVADTGVGIDDETRKHIFEPFFTTKEKGKGTGLGLAMAYGIVKQSEGYILVDSEPGRGTTFDLYFPRRYEEQPESDATRPEGTQEGRGTVLLVEDDDAVRDVVTRSLEISGYTVLPAADAEKALELAGRHAGAVDLLLTDWMLPGMKGDQLARAMRRQRPGIKVLFMSGYAEDAYARKGVLEPGTVVLKKPITPSVLTSTVHQALSGGP